MSSLSLGGMASLVEELQLWGSRRAVGLRQDLGLSWWTYRRLYQEAQRVAWCLERSNLHPGDCILLWAPNSPQWLACLLGALLRGIVIVPIDETTPQDSITRIANQTSAKLVFHSHDKEPGFLNVPARSFASLSSEPLPNKSRALLKEMGMESLAAIMYTSGTTDCSRGVQLTYGNILSQLARFRRWRFLLRLHPYRILVIAPLSHVQGLILGAFLPLSIGLSVVFVNSPSPIHLLRTIHDNRIMILATVPRVLQMLTKALEQRPYGNKGYTVGERLRHERRGWMRRHILFSSLNRVTGYRFWIITVGGASLSQYNEQFWRDTGRFVIHGYGLTETTAIVALNGPFSRRVGSIGKALKHVSLRISDDGEILVRGQNVTPGYFGDNIQGAMSADGYFRTGDLGRVDGGRLYFVGRKKEVIVTSEGFNVAPAEIEAQLNRAPGVRDSVAIGLKRNGCEEVHAVLLLEPHADAAEAVTFANRNLATSHLIRSWTVWPEPDFPRGPLMKAQRGYVAERMDAMNGGPEAETNPCISAPPTLEAIAAESNRKRRIELLARFITEKTAADLGCNSTVLAAGLGLGSLDTVELLAAVERRQQKLLDHTQLPQGATIADIAAILGRAEHGSPVSGRLPVRQPRWSGTILGGLVRRPVRRTVVGFWTHFSRRCVSIWNTSTSELVAPFLLAAAPHYNTLDAFAICSQLPARIANRLLVVTNRDFREYFAPPPDIKWQVKLLYAFAYYFAVPSMFPFTIVPPHGSTRSGLLETAVMVDRGYCPLIFPTGIEFGKTDPKRHDRGTALLALECGVPILPVWITGNEQLGWRPALNRPPVIVAFGRTIAVDSSQSVDEIAAELESSWRSLASASRSGGIVS